jgi:hypothetical protein
MNRLLSIAFAALLLATCSTGPTVRVDVARGEPASNISFRVASSDSTLAPAPISQIQVTDAQSGRGRGAPGAVRWAVAHRPGTPPLQLPATIQYGVAPHNYVSATPAPPLPLGRYEVRINASGLWSVTPFRVTEHGTIE